MIFNKIEEIPDIFCEGKLQYESLSEIGLESNSVSDLESGHTENSENNLPSNSMKKPILIYLELLSQFQSSEIPPFDKLKKSIEEFKEKCLNHIYIFAMNNLIIFLNHRESFSTTSPKKYQNDTFFVDICAKLIYECLDFEEDLNIKDFNFNKFQIKPGNIPYSKKVKLRDKQININSMIEFINSIFRIHNAISVLNTK
jgi:hypothetical protein